MSTPENALRITITAIDAYSPVFKALADQAQAVADQVKAAFASVSGSVDAAMASVEGAAAGVGPEVESSLSAATGAAETLGTTAAAAADEMDAGLKTVQEQTAVATASIKDLQAQLKEALALQGMGVKSPALDATIADLQSQIAALQAAAEAEARAAATVSAGAAEATAGGAEASAATVEAANGGATATLADGLATAFQAAQTAVRDFAAATERAAGEINAAVSSLGAAAAEGAAGAGAAGEAGAAAAAAGSGGSAGSSSSKGPSLKTLGKNAKTLGNDLTMGLTLPLVAVGGASIAAAIQFQQAMELMHTQAGASQAQVQSLSKSVLALAGPTATAPDVLAQGLYHLVSASGVTAQTMDTLKIAAEGAKLGGADLESVTNALNATLVSGIGGASDMSTAMGVLNATVGAGDMHMQDLADALGTGVLASMKGFGVTVQQAGAALAVFGDNNIRGAKAGTDLRMSVQALAAPVKGGAAALASIGLKAADLGNALSAGGLSGALQMLHDHLVASGVAGDQMGEILTRAFGKKAGVGIQVLTEQFPRFQNKLQAVTDDGNTFASAWIAYTHTMAYQWGTFTAQLHQTGIDIGNTLAPAFARLMSVLDGILKAVDDLSKWFAKLSGANQAMILSFIGIAAAIGPVLVIAGNLAIAIAALGGPITLVILGIAALAAGAVVLVTHWKEVKSWTEQTFGGPFSAVMRAAGSVFSAVHNAIRATVGAVWGYISPYLNAVLTEIGGFFTSHWGEIKQVIDAAWSFIKATITIAVDIIKPFLESWLTMLRELWRLAWDAIRDSLKLVWDAISGIFKVALDVFLGIFSVMLDLLTGHWHKAWDDIKLYIGKALKDAATTVKNLLGDVGKEFYDFGANMVKMMADGIRSAIGDVVSAVSDVAKTVKGWLGFHSPTEEGPGADADTWAPNFMRMYTQGIVQGIPALRATLNAALTAPAAGLSSALGYGVSAGSALAAAGGGPAGVVVYLTVQGSVQTEKDLADTVANRLGQALKIRAKYA